MKSFIKINTIILFILLYYLSLFSLSYAQDGQQQNDNIIIDRNNILQNHGYQCTVNKYPCPEGFINFIDLENDLYRYTTTIGDSNIDYNTLRSIVLSTYRTVNANTTEGEICINPNKFSKIIHVRGLENNNIDLSRAKIEANTNTLNGREYTLYSRGDQRYRTRYVFSPKALFNFNENSIPSYVGFCKRNNNPSPDSSGKINGCCPNNFAATRYFYNAIGRSGIIKNSIYNMLNTEVMYADNSLRLRYNLINEQHPAICCPIIQINNKRLYPEMYASEYFNGTDVGCIYNYRAVNIQDTEADTIVNELNNSNPIEIQLYNSRTNQDTNYVFIADIVEPRAITQWERVIQLSLKYKNTDGSIQDTPDGELIGVLSSERFYEKISEIFTTGIINSSNSNLPKTYCNPSNQLQQSCTLQNQPNGNNNSFIVTDSYTFKNAPENRNQNRCERCYENNDPIALADQKLIICRNGQAVEENLINNSVSDTLAYLRARVSLAGDNSNLLQRCRERGGIFIFLGCIDTTPIGVITGLIRIALGIFGGLALLQMIQIGIIYQLGESSGNQKRLEEARQRLISIFTGILILIFSTLIFRILGVNVLDILPSGSI